MEDAHLRAIVALERALVDSLASEFPATQTTNATPLSRLGFFARDELPLASVGGELVAEGSNADP